MTIVRIRDSNPTIETTASNLTFNLGSTSNDQAFDFASITLANTRSWLPIVQGSPSNATTTFFKMLQTEEGVALCGMESLIPEIEPGGFETTISLRTRQDTERARVDAQGMWASQMRADAYMDLANTYASTETTRPASAYALSSAYLTLSNMISTCIGSNAVAYPPSAANVSLVDTFASASITDAPTARALADAYATLSNATESRIASLSNMVRNMVFVATLSALEYSGRGQASNASNYIPPLILNSGEWIVSAPDGESRLYCEDGGKTVYAAPGDFSGGGSFEWRVNDLQRTVATLDGYGDLWVYGNARSSNVECNRLLLGGVPFTSSGASNVGVNLPPGVAPAYALHVNGLVYSDEGVYAMSDAQAKDDITPLERAMEKLRGIRGYSYNCKGRRRLGVLAQDVARVAPEAVISRQQSSSGSSGSSGSNQDLLAVSYADVMALVIEAIHSLDDDLNNLRSR